LNFDMFCLLLSIIIENSSTKLFPVTKYEVTCKYKLAQSTKQQIAFMLSAILKSCDLRRVYNEPDVNSIQRRNGIVIIMCTKIDHIYSGDHSILVILG
jgi:hypothetical protein